jgi:hypothetical protein
MAYVLVAEDGHDIKATAYRISMDDSTTTTTTTTTQNESKESVIISLEDVRVFLGNPNAKWMVFDKMETEIDSGREYLCLYDAVKPYREMEIPLTELEIKNTELQMSQNTKNIKELDEALQRCSGLEMATHVLLTKKKMYEQEARHLSVSLKTWQMKLAQYQKGSLTDEDEATEYLALTSWRGTWDHYPARCDRFRILASYNNEKLKHLDPATLSPQYSHLNNHHPTQCIVIGPVKSLVIPNEWIKQNQKDKMTKMQHELQNQLSQIQQKLDLLITSNK